MGQSQSRYRFSRGAVTEQVPLQSWGSHRADTASVVGQSQSRYRFSRGAVTEQIPLQSWGSHRAGTARFSRGAVTEQVPRASVVGQSQSTNSHMTDIVSLCSCFELSVFHLFRVYLLNCRPRDANRFKVNINIAAQGKVTFNLTYQELLERKKGFYQHTVFVNPGQVVDDMQIEVSIRESREITSVDATTKVLSNDIYTGTCYLHVIVLILYECFANSKVNPFKPNIIFVRHINDHDTEFGVRSGSPLFAYRVFKNPGSGVY